VNDEEHHSECTSRKHSNLTEEAMKTLTQLREEIRDELQSYPRRETKEVQRQWTFMGLFGGHRAYLGHDLISTLMAITFGGLGLWWLKDRGQIGEMTDEWNADQERREREGLPAKEIEGLVLAEPQELESSPPWASHPTHIFEKILTLIITGPVLFTLSLLKLMRAVFSKIPLIGPIYAFFINIQVKFTEIAFSFIESIQIGMITGGLAYLAASFGCVEVGLLMMGVSSVLAFTSLFERRVDTRLGKAAIEWDYLLCSYYHHHRPSPFFVAYLKSAFLVLPRLLGFGAAGERTLYNRLTGQAALVCFLLVPIELLQGIFGSAPFSLLQMISTTATSVILSIFMLSAYAPAICGSLVRNKLLGEIPQLKVAGTVGAVGSAVGVVMGYMSGGAL
jgi:hypothetical protein